MKKVLLIFIFVLMLGISSPIFAANKHDVNYHGVSQAVSYPVSPPGKRHNNVSEQNKHLKEEDSRIKQDGLECNCNGCKKPSLPFIFQVCFVVLAIYGIVIGLRIEHRHKLD